MGARAAGVFFMMLGQLQLGEPDRALADCCCSCRLVRRLLLVTAAAAAGRLCWSRGCLCSGPCAAAAWPACSLLLCSLFCCSGQGVRTTAAGCWAACGAGACCTAARRVDVYEDDAARQVSALASMISLRGCCADDAGQQWLYAAALPSCCSPGWLRGLLLAWRCQCCCWGCCCWRLQHVLRSRGRAGLLRPCRPRALGPAAAAAVAAGLPVCSEQRTALAVP